MLASVCPSTCGSADIELGHVAHPVQRLDGSGEDLEAVRSHAQLHLAAPL